VGEGEGEGDGAATGCIGDWTGDAGAGAEATMGAGADDGVVGDEGCRVWAAARRPENPGLPEVIRGQQTVHLHLAAATRWNMRRGLESVSASHRVNGPSQIDGHATARRLSQLINRRSSADESVCCPSMIAPLLFYLVHNIICSFAQPLRPVFQPLPRKPTSNLPHADLRALGTRTSICICYF
jgi:hypothetical protein